MDWLRWSGGMANVALDVLLQKWRTRHLPPLDCLDADVAGRTCIVTGPTSGIGRETAAALTKRNATVVLACRSAERGEKLLASLRAEAQAAGVMSPQLEVQLLDVASQASVRAFAQRWTAARRPLHVLINNAGVFSFSEVRKESPDGAEVHLATNCLGPHLLTLLLLPCLRAAAEAPGASPARVVNVSSRMHRLAAVPRDDPQLRRHYSSVLAYSTSKTAQIALTLELQRRLDSAGANIRCFAADPGEVLTDITRTLPPPLRAMYKALLPRILFTAQQGARSSVHCAGSAEALHQHSGGSPCFSSGCQPVAPAAHAADGQLAQWLWPWAAEQLHLTSAELNVACK